MRTTPAGRASGGPSSRFASYSFPRCSKCQRACSRATGCEFSWRAPQFLRAVSLAPCARCAPASPPTRARTPARYSDSKARFNRSVRAKGFGSDIRFVGRAGIERLLRSHGKALIHPIELASLRRLYEEFLAQLQRCTAAADGAAGRAAAPEARGKAPRRTMVAVLRDLIAVLRASHVDAYPAVAKCWCYPSRVALVASRLLMLQVGCSCLLLSLCFVYLFCCCLLTTSSSFSSLQIAEDSADLLISPARLVGALGAERNVKELLQSLLVEVLSRGEMSFTTTVFGPQSGSGSAAARTARAQWSAKQHRMRPLTVEARAKKDREEDLAFLLHCRHLSLRAVVVANNAMLSSRFISPRQRKFIATVLAATAARLPVLHIAVFDAMELTLPPLPPTTISSRALALSGAARGAHQTPAKSAAAEDDGVLRAGPLFISFVCFVSSLVCFPCSFVCSSLSFVDLPATACSAQR